ncbi:serine O-acetyltransferase [Pseudoalteromonas sp. MQS005]|uniref:serine O-acetyltransferase n=1 Tax=Pseudoalteromonas sp. MQS005 TaxID=1854052 RepID=UPI0007E50902|nr:serine O-acetyltransferase [Pseudoalteromonas sp. MQS005]
MFLKNFGHACYKKRIPLIPTITNVLIRTIYRCAIYSETSIGEGTKFGYGGIGVVIHKRAVIGKNCIIGTNVTIGGRSKSKEVPRIGDGVYIATGAKVLGDITIGENSVVGANAVVLSDVPPNSVVVGIPAKVIKSGINMKDFR